MLTVTSDRDRVILAFASRGRDLCMKPDVARRVVESIRESVKECREWVEAGGRPHLVRGEPRGAFVRSWDGNVNVRFDAITDREEIPYQAAERLADEIEAKCVEAEARMTILWTPAETL